MNAISSPSVAIIIINWNGFVHTKACLESLQKAIYPNFLPIVVDNHSSLPEGKKLKELFPSIHLIESEVNLGFTGGNNLGIRYALSQGFDYILLLNNDTEVEADFLDHLVSFLEFDQAYFAVQPKIRFALNKDIIWNAGGGYFKPLEMSWSKGIGKKDIGQFDHPKETPWITGCAFLVRSSTIRKGGLLDESFFAYYEDVEWSFRLKRLGGRLYYLPKSVVYHVAGASSIQKKSKEGTVSPYVHYLRTRNHLYLIRKHGNIFSFVLSLIYQTLKNSAFILFLLLRGRNKKVKAIIKGHWHGLFGEIK